MFEYKFECEKCKQKGKFEGSLVKEGKFVLYSLGGIVPMLECKKCGCDNSKTVHEVIKSFREYEKEGGK